MERASIKIRSLIRSRLFLESGKSLFGPSFSRARVGRYVLYSNTSCRIPIAASLAEDVPVLQNRSFYAFSGSTVRFHSTRSNEADQERKETISRLLSEVPIGSMAPADWKDARQLIFGGPETTNNTSNTIMAWKLLDRLVEESKVAKTQVDNAFLNKVVGAWRSNPDPHPAEVLKKLDAYAPHLLPDVKTYCMIVDAALKRSGLHASEGPRFVEGVLERMNQESISNPKVIPNVVIYGTLLDAWAKSGDRRGPQKAETILLQMQELYESGNVDVKPNTFSFNTVISAWARTREPGAAAEGGSHSPANARLVRIWECMM